MLVLAAPGLVDVPLQAARRALLAVHAGPLHLEAHLHRQQALVVLAARHDQVTCACGQAWRGVGVVVAAAPGVRPAASPGSRAVGHAWQAQEHDQGPNYSVLGRGGEQRRQANAAEGAFPYEAQSARTAIAQCMRCAMRRPHL